MKLFVLMEKDNPTTVLAYVMPDDVMLFDIRRELKKRRLDKVYTVFESLGDMINVSETAKSLAVTLRSLEDDVIADAKRMRRRKKKKAADA